MHLYNKIGKRFFDLFSTSIALFCLLPLFFIISIIIKLTSKGPVFFSQIRVGKNFKPFKIYKFRSMITDAPKNGPSVTSSDDPRITPIGKILRKTKLDELPQLINVLKGDMSIVGPRPEVSKFVDFVKKDYETVLSVKPGITDFAAIQYRDEEEVMKCYENKEKAYVEKVLPEKIKLYKKYISEKNFFTDLSTIFLTLMKILPSRPATIAAEAKLESIGGFRIDPVSNLVINPITNMPINISKSVPTTINQNLFFEENRSDNYKEKENKQKALAF